MTNFILSFLGGIVGCLALTWFVDGNIYTKPVHQAFYIDQNGDCYRVVEKERQPCDATSLRKAAERNKE